MKPTLAVCSFAFLCLISFNAHAQAPDTATVPTPVRSVNFRALKATQQSVDTTKAAAPASAPMPAPMLVAASRPQAANQDSLRRARAAALEKVTACGRAVSAAGLVTYLSGMVLGLSVPLIEYSEGQRPALATAITSGALAAVGPIVTAAGATRVQAAYEGFESPSGSVYANNWGLYKVGMSFAAAADMLNAVPAITDNPDVAEVVWPFALILGLTADAFIIANSARCLRYTRNVRNSVRANGIRLSVRPERTQSGATGLALVCHLD
jgi:hypothetical protein